MISPSRYPEPGPIIPIMRQLAPIPARQFLLNLREQKRRTLCTDAMADGGLGPDLSWENGLLEVSPSKPGSKIASSDPRIAEKTKRS